MKAAENNKFHNFFISETRIKDTSYFIFQSSLFSIPADIIAV